jgi:hypothetical protein
MRRFSSTVLFQLQQIQLNYRWTMSNSGKTVALLQLLIFYLQVFTLHLGRLNSIQLGYCRLVAPSESWTKSPNTLLKLSIVIFYGDSFEVKNSDMICFKFQTNISATSYLAPFSIL